MLIISDKTAYSSSALINHNMNCDPCIDRPTHRILAIVHGTESSRFWRQVRKAAVQAAADMRVDFSMILYDAFDDETMARDILEVASKSSSPLSSSAADPSSSSSAAPDALIVSIPSEAVREAVERAVREHRVPVFGINSGYEVAASAGVLGFVSMDEYRGGAEAAKEFLALANVTRAAFVNVEEGNSALQQRLEGFQDRLGFPVDVHVVDQNSPDGGALVLRNALEGCPYDAVLLGGSSVLEATTSAFYANGCALSEHLLGTFDTDSKVFTAIALGKLSFAISQQQHLQGAFSVVMASLYATTGKKLAPSSESPFGVYTSGPSVINLWNLPPDTFQECEAEAFPVCAADGDGSQSPSSSRGCGCTKRSEIVIAGVTHGRENDPFWDQVFSGAFQAADDMDIQLRMERLVLEDPNDILANKMANRMIAYCNEGVDGLVVTIRSTDLVSAIQHCLELNVPVISINAGFEASQSLGLLNHVAQNEYVAGLGAGRIMIEAGMTKGYCLIHERDHQGLIQRCQGFADAIGEVSNVTYFGSFFVARDNTDLFRVAVEDAVGEDGDWDGVGTLLCAGRLVDAGVNLHTFHPKMLIGSFDTSDALYDALDENILLFGIDQEQYLQGYLPVVFLTWFSYTRQKLETFSVETGPRFVDSGPTLEKQVCEAKLFKVCPEPKSFNLNQLSGVRGFGLALAGIVWASSIVFAVWLVWNRNILVVKASQPIFLGTICAGTFVMALAVVPLSFDDSIASDTGCDIACMAAPWLFFLGFTITFAALFSKIWRVNKLLASAKRLRRVKISPRDVALPFAVLFTLNVIFLLVWTLVDPMVWTRKGLCGKGDLTSYGHCSLGSKGTSTAMFVCLVAVNICALLLANYEAYRARKVSTEYGESQYVAIAMLSILQILIVGVPLIFLLVEYPQASYFVKVGIIFIIGMSALLLMFVPKILSKRKANRDQQRGQSRTAASIPRRAETMDDSVSFGNNVVGLRVDVYCSSCAKHACRDDMRLRRLAALLKERGISAKDLFLEAGIPLDTLLDEEANGPLDQREHSVFGTWTNSLYGRRTSSSMNGPSS